MKSKLYRILPMLLIVGISLNLSLRAEINPADHEALEAFAQQIPEIEAIIEKVLKDGDSSGLHEIDSVNPPRISGASSYVQQLQDVLVNRIVAPLKSFFATWRNKGKESAVPFGMALKKGFDIPTLMNTLTKKLQDIYAHAEKSGDAILSQKAQELMTAVNDMKSRWQGITPGSMLANIRKAL